MRGLYDGCEHGVAEFRFREALTEIMSQLVGDAEIPRYERIRSLSTLDRRVV